MLLDPSNLNHFLLRITKAPITPGTQPAHVNKVTIKKANTETILDEEVPLAAAPKTGDYTFVLIAVIAVLALGIAATFFFEKKRRNSK